MLPSVFPITMEFASIRPVESAQSMFFIIQILSLVSSSISPLSYSIAMHFIGLPLSLILSVVAPHINT